MCTVLYGEPSATSLTRAAAHFLLKSQTRRRERGGRRGRPGCVSCVTSRTGRRCLTSCRCLSLLLLLTTDNTTDPRPDGRLPPALAGLLINGRSPTVNTTCQPRTLPTLLYTLGPDEGWNADLNIFKWRRFSYGSLEHLQKADLILTL